MSKLAFFVVFLMSAAAQPVQETVPQTEEQRRLEAVVAYEDFQRALMQWDSELASEYEGRGERELAERQLEFAARRIDNVLERYRLFLSEFPANAVARNYYGEALADLKGRDAEASLEWRESIELDPGLADPHNNLGIFYGHFGQPGKSIDEFRRAVELDPNVAVFRFDLALAYYNFRYVAISKFGWTLPQLFEEILKESRKARALAPKDLEIAADYARTFFGAEDFKATPDWPEALSAWQYCLALTEDSVERFNILLNLGRVALNMDRKEEARQYLGQALSIHPDSATAKKLLQTAQ